MFLYFKFSGNLLWWIGKGLGHCHRYLILLVLTEHITAVFFLNLKGNIMTFWDFQAYFHSWGFFSPNSSPKGCFCFMVYCVNVGFTPEFAHLDIFSLTIKHDFPGLLVIEIIFLTLIWIFKARICNCPGGLEGRIWIAKTHSPNTLSLKTILSNS